MPVLKYAQVPLQPHLRACALLIPGVGLVRRRRLHRFVPGANFVGHLALAFAEALKPVKYLRTLAGQFQKRAGQRHQQPWTGVCAALPDEIGAEMSITGQVQKVSTLILNMNIYIREVATGKTISVVSADMRGNTEESWTRTLDWLIRTRLLVEPAQ